MNVKIEFPENLKKKIWPIEFYYIIKIFIKYNVNSRKEINSKRVPKENHTIQNNLEANQKGEAKNTLLSNYKSTC